MLNKEQIIELISTGENSYIEFKEDAVDNHKLAKEMCGLSNHNGGYILLGVADDKKICGLSRTDNEERIMNLAFDSVKPPIHPSYYEIIIDSKKIGIIRLDTGHNKPYYIEEQVTAGQKKKTIKIFYTRFGSTTREVKHRDELQRLFQASANIHYEVIPVSTAHMDDISVEKIGEYIQNCRSSISLNEYNLENLLVNLELAISTETCLRPTIAGLLLFGKGKISKHLPQAGITCVKIDGEDMSAAISDHKFYERDMFSNFDDTMAFFYRYNTNKYEIKGSRREDHFDYPEKSFREILANALIHRDYTIFGTQISVHIFNSKIEIISPGSLPNTITVEKMKLGIKYYRNPVLVQYFYDADIIERLGQGIPKANRWLRENGNTELEIIADETQVKVTMQKVHSFLKTL